MGKVIPVHETKKTRFGVSAVLEDNGRVFTRKQGALFPNFENAAYYYATLVKRGSKIYVYLYNEEAKRINSFGCSREQEVLDVLLLVEINTPKRLKLREENNV